MICLVSLIQFKCRDRGLQPANLHEKCLIFENQKISSITQAGGVSSRVVDQSNIHMATLTNARREKHLQSCSPTPINQTHHTHVDSRNVDKTGSVAS